MEFAEELLAKPSGDFELGADPETGHQIVAKDGRYGPYVTEVLPEGTPKTGKNAVKPRTGLAVQVDVAGHGDADGRAEADVAAARRRRGRRGRGDHRAERPLRPVPEEGHGLAVAADRGPALHDHARRGAGDLRAAQAARPGRRQAAAEGAGRRPGQRQAGRRQGRPLRPVRHRRRDQRDPARPTTASRTITPERGYELLAEKRAKAPGEEDAKKAPAKKATAKKAAAAKKTAAKKTATAKKATTAAKKTTTAKKTARRRPPRRAETASPVVLVAGSVTAAGRPAAPHRSFGRQVRETNAPASLWCRGGRYVWTGAPGCQSRPIG